MTDRIRKAPPPNPDIAGALDDEVEDDGDEEALVVAEPTGAIADLEQPSRRPRRPAPPISRTTVSPINADRPVFTLSVAADLLGMHPRTLRIYEEEGLVVPARTATKRRRYSQNDIKRFQFIQHLTQRLRVNLAGVRIILEMMNALEACGVDFTPRLYEMAEQLNGIAEEEE